MYTIDTLITEIAHNDHNRNAIGFWRLLRGRTDDPMLVLGQISRKLSDLGDHDCGIVVSPPHGPSDMDTASVALVQVAAGLMAHGLENGSLSQALAEPAPWAAKVGVVKKALETHLDRIVLLIAEPRAWAAPKGGPERMSFGEHADIICRIVQNSNCRRVVLEQRGSPSVEPLDIACGEAALRMLADPTQWDSLADFAGAVLKRYGESLQRLTETELRFLVALAATGEALPNDVSNPFGYIRRLGIALRMNAGELCRVLSKLMVLRGSFGASLPDRLGAAALEQPWRDILGCCLLRKIDYRFFLPAALSRASVLDGGWGTWRPSASDELHLHSEVARYYCEESGVVRNSRHHFRAYHDDMEAFHHASLAGDRLLALQQPVYFSEQFDALGRALSLARLYDQAVDAFQDAIRWDPEDDYAHHYLAFNLDIQGKERERVEAHYVSAISYAPGNSWWWSRWISFLITVGRTDRAEDEWGEAISALGLDEQEAVSQSSTYFHLHSWVIHLLLQRGQLDFAGRVLESIPSSVWTDDARTTGILRRLKTHWRSLLEARRDKAVMPVFIDPDRWWVDRPKGSFAEPRLDGMDLRSWHPGRIENIEEDEISILLGLPPEAGETDYRVATWRLTRAEFEQMTSPLRYDLQAGRFIEVCYYGDDQKPHVFVRPEEEHKLPPLPLDPARYLRDRWGGE